MSFQAFLLFLIYTISVLSYTLYGYGKALNEGFCLRRTEGRTLSYSEATKPSVVQFDSGVEGLISFDRYGCDRPYCLNVTDFFVNDDLASLERSVLNLDKGVKFFSIEKAPRTDYWSDIGQIAETFRMVYKTVVGDKQLTLDCFGSTYEDGALSWVKVRYEEGFADVIYENVPKNCTFKRCTIRTQEITCELGSGYNKSFVVITLIAIGLLLFSLFISKFVMRFRVFLKKALDIFSLDPRNDLKFCNPLNGLFGEFKAGEKCFRIKNDCSPLPTGIESDSLVCPNYFFKITGSKLTIINRSNSSLIYSNDLSPIKAQQVKFLLYWLNVDLKFWVTNSSTSHYLEISEFSLFLDSGDLYLSYENCEKDSCSTGLGILEMMTSFFKLEMSEAKTMLAHNRNFFGSLNLPAIFKVLDNKTCWTDKPHGVGNSQWKRYTNDLCLLNISLGKGGFFCQSKKGKLAPPTESLKKSISDNDCSFINGEFDFKLSDQPALARIDKMRKTLDEVVKSRERGLIVGALKHCILGNETMTEDEIFSYIEDRGFDTEKIKSETVSKCEGISNIDLRKLREESSELQKKLKISALREEKGRPIDLDSVNDMKRKYEAANSLLMQANSLPPSYKSVLKMAGSLRKNDPEQLKRHLKSTLEEKLKISGGEIFSESVVSKKKGILENSHLLFKIVKRKKHHGGFAGKGVIRRTVNLLSDEGNIQNLKNLIHSNPYSALKDDEEGGASCGVLGKEGVILSEYGPKNPIKRAPNSYGKGGKGVKGGEKKKKMKDEKSGDKCEWDGSKYKMSLKKCIVRGGLSIENVNLRAFEKMRNLEGAQTKVVMSLRASTFAYNFGVIWKGKKIFSAGNLKGDQNAESGPMSKFTSLKAKVIDDLDLTRINGLLDEYLNSFKKILLG